MEERQETKARNNEGSFRRPSDAGALVFDMLRMALSDLPFKQQVEKLLTLLHGALLIDGSLLYTLNKKGDALHLLSARGVPTVLIEKIQQVPRSYLLPYIFGGDGRPIRLTSRQHDPPFDQLSAEFERLVVIPLFGKDDPLGILIACRQALGDRTPLDLEMMGLLGSQVAVILDNVRLRRMAEELAILNERNRLARELHDSVTQSLYSLTLFAEAGERMLAMGQVEQAAAYLTRVGETGIQALREMRLLVHRLRPPILAEEGLRAAISKRFRSVEGRTGVDYRLDMPDHLLLPAAVEEAAYFIVQEALNNALKHARSSEVEVLISIIGENALQLRVFDNGIGFDLVERSNTAGLGLTTMRERAELLGGSMEIITAPEKGTVVEALLPLQADGEESSPSSPLSPPDLL